LVSGTPKFRLLREASANVTVQGLTLSGSLRTARGAIYASGRNITISSRISGTRRRLIPAEP